jgi:hypothetical protein
MRGSYHIRYGADAVVAMLSYQAVTLWSLGWADRALRARQDAVKEARRIEHPVSICVALAAPSSTLLPKMGDQAEAEESVSLWCMPALLRIKGELLAEEELLGQALDMANGQGALAWELRAAFSLARTWINRGRAAEGRELVRRVLQKFSEGFGTADLCAANALLEG